MASSSNFFCNLFDLNRSSAELLFSFEHRSKAGFYPCKKDQSRIKSKDKTVPLFRTDEAIRGILTVKIHGGKSMQHNGLTVKLLGRIKLSVDRKDGVDDFIHSCYELQPRGAIIQGEKAFSLDFSKVDKIHETYHGKSVHLRYFLRATLARGYYPLIQEQDILIQAQMSLPPINQSIQLEVGIEECLHLAFQYEKSTYHLNDVVIGKIVFHLVRIKIKHMELVILRRETVGSSGNCTQRHCENEIVTKFEIMDGAPIKGENVPVRLYLAPYDLTPTYCNVLNRFSVKYFLNLVLVDEEERRYFKQQEITLWRKHIG
ncbi:unnamed protein product [Peronospora belbahrii]|uniref:Vacuolar protein sorting-associated protein 26 n=1 Tax=Peronospora belbahrii TaxID=622444 RepID=A0ABN8CJH4_9STRA|nr:unnamed protein product [Peronospora belbahrii]